MTVAVSTPAAAGPTGAASSSKEHAAGKGDRAMLAHFEECVHQAHGDVPEDTGMPQWIARTFEAPPVTAASAALRTQLTTDHVRLAAANAA